MEQILLIIGASIFGILGTIHLLYTFFTNKFEAYDSSVIEAMKATSPILTKETSIWKAWVGFNASHSLGAMLFAGIYIPFAASHFSIIQQSLWFSVFTRIYWDCLTLLWPGDTGSKYHLLVFRFRRFVF